MAVDAGEAFYSAVAVLLGSFDMTRLVSMAGFTLHVGVVSDVARVEKRLSVSQNVATDTVVAVLVAGFFEGSIGF